MVAFKNNKLCNCFAYSEWDRTRGLSAFNWQHSVLSSKKINQYYTKTVFSDHSYVLVSSHQNKVDLNTMIAFTRLGEGIATRILFV